jgi:tellurium resistance protein TerD
MIRLSDEEAKLISSEVKQPHFDSNENLLACTQCGSRRVGGCTCAQKVLRCTPTMDYAFGCLYCKELQIDYSLPTRADVASHQGDTVKLSQGQEVRIRYADDRPLNKILVGIGWDPAKRGWNIDVDSSVVVMAPPGHRHELVYFANKRHSSGCVIHHGDNLTGRNSTQGDDENISVYLDQVPKDRDHLYFVLNIYHCAMRHQTLGGIENLYIRIYDPDSKKALVEYRVEGNFSADTALIIGVAYRKDGAWVFKAIGKGSKAVDVQELAKECARRCGGE